MKKTFTIFALFFTSLNLLAQLPTTDLVARFNPSDTNGTYYDDVPETREIRQVQQGRCAKGTFTISHAGNGYLNFDYTKPWTISFWMYTSATVQNNLFAKYNTTSGKGFKLNQISGSSLQMFIDANGSSARATRTFGNIGSQAYTLTNKWVHITVTYDGSGLGTGITGYIQAIKAGGTNPSSGTLAGGDITNTNDFKITATNSNIFDFRIYNIVKTVTEIRGIADCNLDTTGLLAGLRLDEQSGSTFYNSYKTAAKISTYGQSVGNAAGTSITHSTQPVYSFQNRRGYNTSSGVFIPKNEADTNNVDALGNSLTYYLPVRYRMTVASGVMNFNPDNAPLSKITKDEYPFTVLPIVPTSYLVGDSSKFGKGEMTNPLFVDRSDTIEKNYLIYRSFKSFADVGVIEAYINHKTLLYCTIGQSNGQGQGNSSELPGWCPATNTDARLWKNGTLTFDTKNTVQATHVGPGFITSSLLTISLKDIVYVIENSTGGSSLPYILNYPYWLPVQNVSNLYTQFLTQITNALTLLTGTGRDPEIIINFDQGETNNADNNYGSELKVMISQMRHDIDSLFPSRGYDSIPFICRLISPEQKANVTSVRNGLLSCVDSTHTNFIPNLYIYDATITSGDLYPSPNNIHFTTQGQLSNGSQIYEIIRNENLYKFKPVN